MPKAQEFLDADQVIKASLNALGEAIDSIHSPLPPAFARAIQAERNLHLQIDAEFGLLTSTEAGLRMGSRSRTPRNLASSARLAGRLLAIVRGNSAHYPAFQFGSDGQPLLVVKQLRKLAQDSHWSERGVIEWLMSPTTYLNDQRPVDRLASDPKSVIEAAELAWNASW
ncbi:MAG TPA: hypothetical protein PKA04_04250 [Marmoricola sp.]|nr:hypothetical protein [Marmoricola sp.]